MNITVTNAEEHDAAVRQLARDYPVAMSGVVQKLGPVPSPGPGTPVEQMQGMIDLLTTICLLGGE